MLKGIYSLIIKEFLAVWQDKKSRLILIWPPLIQLFIFAFAATLDVTNVSIAVLNRDEGKVSYELCQRFQGSPYMTKIKYIHDIQELQKEIELQRSIIGIHMDSEFSKNILSGKPGQLQIILDGRRSNSAQIVQGYAMSIIQQYNYDLAQQLNYVTPSSHIIPRNWFNPNLIYTWFTVPGLVAILTMSTALLVTSLSVAREREMGTFDQLLVSPLRPIDILIGKTIPGVVIGMIEGSLILVAAIFAFDIPFTGSLIALYVSMTIFVFSIVGVGLFLSSICKTQQQALLAVFVFISTSVILSGFATPIDNMPLWLQKVTSINPLRFFLVIIRGIFLKNMSLRLIASNLVPIILMAFVNLSVASWFFKKRLE